MPIPRRSHQTNAFNERLQVDLGYRSLYSRFPDPHYAHPATHPHSLGYFAGYICGLLFWIGIPLFVISWIVSLVWKAIH